MHLREKRSEEEVVNMIGLIKERRADSGTSSPGRCWEKNQDWEGDSTLIACQVFSWRMDGWVEQEDDQVDGMRLEV